MNGPEGAAAGGRGQPLPSSTSICRPAHLASEQACPQCRHPRVQSCVGCVHASSLEPPANAVGHSGFQPARLLPYLPLLPIGLAEPGAALPTGAGVAVGGKGCCSGTQAPAMCAGETLAFSDTREKVTSGLLSREGSWPACLRAHLPLQSPQPEDAYDNTWIFLSRRLGELLFPHFCWPPSAPIWRQRPSLCVDAALGLPDAS